MDNIIRPQRPTIGVLPGWQAYSGTLDSFLGQVLHGVQSAAHKLGCNLLLGCGVLQPGMFNTTNRPALPMLIPDVDFVPIGPWNCDGILVIPPIEKPDVMAYFQELLATGYPVAFAGDWKAGPGTMVDNEDGIRQAVFHLVEHGHRRIAFIAGSTRIGGDSEYRLIGYQRALKEAGLPFDPALVERGFHDDEGGREALHRLLDRKAKFSAVIASNDQSAVGALLALKEAGLSVPQDVALIGFDDRLEARAQVPSLTTVHFPMFELGYRAVELIVRYIQAGKVGHDLARLPTRLVIRESCGCLPGDVGQVVLDRAHRNGRNARKALPVITEIQREISSAVYNDLHRVGLREINRFSRRLVEQFRASLLKANPLPFHNTIQNILEFTASQEDDLLSWQKAITILRSHLDDLLRDVPAADSGLAEDYLDQARVAISNIAERESSRRLVAASQMAAVNGWMAAHFFAVTDANELFDVLNRYLPQIGIQHAMAFFYEADGDDPVARSRMQGETAQLEELRWFPTRQFPPAGLYPPDEPLNLALLPLQTPDGPIGFIAYQGDALEWNALITTQLMAALRGIRLYQTAVEARRHAEEANRMKGRFLSVVSHELRTPLNLISGLSNMLLKERRDGEAEGAHVNWDDLERIFFSAQHLDGLIRDVLDLARIDVGKLNLVLEPLNLKEVFDAVGVIGEQLAQEKSLAWTVKIEKDLPQVRGDRTRLRQVILNLVNNAVKFTSTGEVVLSAMARGDEVVISVTDTGLGIPVDEQSLIFDEFSQSDRTAARGYGGLGLGLAICKRLVEMHGGVIEVASTGREGKGSTFYFTLPVLKEQTPQSVKESFPETGHVILLVQDSQAGEMIQAQFAHQNIATRMYVVDKDSDWLSWVILEDPDAVVLDFGLTSQSGWEILKLLKENPATQDMPVMFYSLENGTDCAELLELNLLSKPVSGDDLAEALSSQGLLGVNGKNGKKSILVVDDDPQVLALHVRQIQALSPNFHILQAQDGHQALALIREARPVLVLLDLMMPELDGFGVLEALQADASIRGTPVIVVTGQVLTEEDMQRLNQGVSSVLSKGMFSAQETIEHISTVLERKRKPGSETRRAVMKAMAFIQVHYADGISRSDVAAYVGLSERHLTRCFHQETGLTPITYLNRFRVQQAKELMRAGKTSITEIALDVGFSNSGYFTKVFRDETGLSPRAFMQGD